MNAQAILSENKKSESLVINGKVEIKRFESGKWNFIVMDTRNKWISKQDCEKGITAPRIEVYCSKHRTEPSAIESMNKTASDWANYLLKNPETIDRYESEYKVLEVER